MSDSYEDRLREVEIDNAVLKSQVNVLTNALDENTQAVKLLTEAVSQGKGAWVAIAAVAGVLAFIINLIVSFVKG